MNRRGEGMDANLFVGIAISLALLLIVLYILSLGKESGEGITDAVKSCESQARFVFPDTFEKAGCYVNADCTKEDGTKDQAEPGQEWRSITTVGKVCEPGQYCCALVKIDEP